MWDVHLLEATMKPGSAVGASSPPKRREHPRFSGWFRRTTLIDAFIKYVCLVGGEKCFHLANIACTTIRVGITILLSCYTLYGISVPHCEPQSHTWLCTTVHFEMGVTDFFRNAMSHSPFAIPLQPGMTSRPRHLWARQLFGQGNFTYARSISTSRLTQCPRW